MAEKPEPMDIDQATTIARWWTEAESVSPHDVLALYERGRKAGLDEATTPQAAPGEVERDDDLPLDGCTQMVEPTDGDVESIVQDCYTGLVNNCAIDPEIDQETQDLALGIIRAAIEALRGGGE